MKKFATLALTLALGFAAVATTGCGDEKTKTSATTTGGGKTTTSTTTTTR